MFPTFSSLLLIVFHFAKLFFFLFIFFYFFSLNLSFLCFFFVLQFSNFYGRFLPHSLILYISIFFLLAEKEKRGFFFFGFWKILQDFCPQLMVKGKTIFLCISVPWISKNVLLIFLSSSSSSFPTSTSTSLQFHSPQMHLHLYSHLHPTNGRGYRHTFPAPFGSWPRATQKFLLFFFSCLK